MLSSSVKFPGDVINILLTSSKISFACSANNYYNHYITKLAQFCMDELKVSVSLGAVMNIIFQCYFTAEVKVRENQ